MPAADQSNEQRETRAADLDQERADRACALAVETALTQKETDYRLADHDRQLKVINGSIEQTGRELVSMHRVINDLAGKFDEFAANQHTRDEVARQLKNAAQGTQAAAEKANEKQISNRAFAIGVIGLILTMMSVGVAIITLAGH